MQQNLNYSLLARQSQDTKIYGFTHQSISFSQNSFNIFAGLNTVDNAQNVAKTFAVLKQHNLSCARMGAFKPRTSPYNFQGHGEKCLGYVFELAGKYGIKIIAMELTHDSQIELIYNILETMGHPTSVMIQIGTRNAQNFELLKAVGKQKIFPVLYKRGYGISLDESLAACEYIAHAGNNKIIFCLRGMKSQFASPHRNFVDFAHTPVIKRLTKMPVCIDPSHAIGNYDSDLTNIPDIFNVSAQAVIAGANMLLVDIHPEPVKSLVDAKQAISLETLEIYLADMALCRKAYLQRASLFATQPLECQFS
jgi:3-deoxy-7-phosphoheptulonate synthase